MTDCAQTILTAAISAYTVGWLSRLWVASRPRRDRDPDWRRSFNHENTNPPNGQPPMKFVTSGRNPPPTSPKPKIIPKPQFPSPRKIQEGFLPHSRQRSPMTNAPSRAERRALFEQVLLQKEWHSLSHSSIPPDAVIRAAVEVVLGDPVQDATCPTAARYRAEFLALAEAIDLSPLP